MKLYRVTAAERIFEETYIMAESEEEAKVKATEDWTDEWETYDGEDFEIEDVEEVSEEELSQMKWLSERADFSLTNE